MAVPAVSGSSVCVPTELIPVLTTLGPGFNVPAGFSQGLEALVQDDCGTPLIQDNGKVSAAFSTGQGQTYMQSLNNGRWDLTWQTGSTAASQVTLTVQAQHLTLPIAGSAQVTGALGLPQPAPQISNNGVVAAANYAAPPLAPGSIISIFGSQLSDVTTSATTLPLSTQLDNTTVMLGDMKLPLFYAGAGAGQVNALVPYETAINTNLQLVVQRDNTYATPVHLDEAAAQPAIFEYGAQQTAIAVDVNGNLNGPTNPAHAGDVLVLYCSGLGAVTPAVADGAAASLTALTYAVNPVTLTVGGECFLCGAVARFGGVI